MCRRAALRFVCSQRFHMVPFFLLLLFVFFFSYFLALLLMCFLSSHSHLAHARRTQVFPMQVRGKAVSLVVFVNRLLSGLIATSFLRCVEGGTACDIASYDAVSRCPPWTELDRRRSTISPAAPPLRSNEDGTSIQKAPRDIGKISSNRYVTESCCPGGTVAYFLRHIDL